MIAFVSLGDAAASATAIGVIFAAWGLLLQRGQARTQFEDGIVKQYREILKPDLVLNVLLADLLEKVPQNERQRLHHIYLYLDLCNEQVFLRAIGRVSRATWTTQWSEGIQDYISENQLVADSWLVIKRETDHFRELRAFESEGWKDPRKWESPRRRPLVRLGVCSLRVPQPSSASPDENAPRLPPREG